MNRRWWKRELSSATPGSLSIVTAAVSPRWQRRSEEIFVFLIVILFPYILLGTLAGNAVQGGRYKIVCISAVAFAVNLVVWPYTLSWRGVPIYIALTAVISAGLIYWCGIARRRALKIVGWYVVANSILVLLAAAIFAVG